MDQLQEVIKQLQLNIAALIKQDIALQKKVTSLEKENEKIKLLLAREKEELLLLKQKMEGSTASSLFTGSLEKEALKKTLDKYIAEIDKGLSQLKAK